MRLARLAERCGIARRAARSVAPGPAGPGFHTSRSEGSRVSWRGASGTSGWSALGRLAWRLAVSGAVSGTRPARGFGPPLAGCRDATRRGVAWVFEPGWPGCWPGCSAGVVGAPSRGVWWGLCWGLRAA